MAVASVFAVVSIPAIRSRVAMPSCSARDSVEPSNSLRGEQVRQEVVAGTGGPLVELLAEVGIDLLVGLACRGGIVAAALDDGGRPGEEAVVVGRVDAEDLGEHDGRHREGVLAYGLATRAAVAYLVRNTVRAT
jgi:hypothetical protein